MSALGPSRPAPFPLGLQQGPPTTGPGAARTVAWRQRTPAVLIAGWLLLAIAWVFGNPPFAAPDEADHYVRTVGIAEGHLVGLPAPEARIGLTAAEIRFDEQTQRAVFVPANLNPRPFDCYLANPHLSAACLNRSAPHGAPVRLVTTVGSYPPLALLAPAAVISAGDNAAQADRVARLASLSVAVTMLIAAAVALFVPAAGWLSLAGILAACTPTAIFLAASLTPSGMAVSAGIALTASMLRIGRADWAPRWVWSLFGLSAAALALSHPTGPAWALLLVVGFIALDGVSAIRARVQRQWRAAFPGLMVFTVGILASLVWQAMYGASTPLAYRAIPLALTHAPDQYWPAVRDLVAGFGYLEFRLPLVAYLLWFAFVAAVAVAAVRVGTRRQQVSVVVTGALTILIPVGVWVVFARGVGIGINGREYMPVLVGFPILAGEIVLRNRARLSRALARTLAVMATLAGGLQFVAWYLNARRAAVGTAGSLIFPAHPHWSPGLGWYPWIAVAASGALLIAATSMDALTGAGPRRAKAEASAAAPC